MTETVQTWEALRNLIEQGDAGALHDFFESLSGGEAARALSRLTDAEQQRVLTTLAPADAADIIEEIPDAQAIEIVERLAADDAAAIVAEMHSDEQADLIASISQENAEAILSELAPEQASGVRQLASYLPDIAGGLMVTEFLCFEESTTIADIVSDLHARAEEIADYEVQYLYVSDDRNRLVGVVPLRNLLLARPDRRLGTLMIRSPVVVSVHTPLDELGDFFDHNHWIGVPAVDDSGVLVGVVKRHDVREALGDRADADFLKSQGIVGGEELRTMPLWRRARCRLSWLSVNVLLNIVAASVIAIYQDTLASVIALAVFLPIISDMSGCSGNQAVAVSIRELSLGLVQPLEIARVWLKEISVGLINGIVLGFIIALAAWLWKGNPYLGLVVGLALAVNTMVAVSIGGTVPLVLKRFNVDPALASGPVLTTLTDMCGFFLVLSMATLGLQYLV